MIAMSTDLSCVSSVGYKLDFHAGLGFNKSAMRTNDSVRALRGI